MYRIFYLRSLGPLGSSRAECLRTCIPFPLPAPAEPNVCSADAFHFLPAPAEPNVCINPRELRMTPNHYQSHDKSVLSKLYQNITKNWLPELDKIFRFELYSI